MEFGECGGLLRGIHDGVDDFLRDLDALLVMVFCL